MDSETPENLESEAAVPLAPMISTIKSPKSGSDGEYGPECPMEEKIMNYKTNVSY